MWQFLAFTVALLGASQQTVGEYQILGVDVVPASPFISKGIVLQWVQTLQQAGAGTVREASATAGPPVRSVGSRGIWLTAVIERDGSLRIGNQTIRLGDRQRLRVVLDRLRREGPLAFAPQTEHWGLPAPLFQKLMEWLSVPADVSCEDAPLGEILKELDSRIEPSIRVSEEAQSTVEGARVTVELKSVSAGTALAAILGAYGLAFEPHWTGGTTVELVVAPADHLDRRWPIGWRPSVTPGKAVPALFEKVTIVPQRVSLAQLVGAVASYCKVPVLIDQLLLRGRDLDPATTVVSVGGTNKPLALLFSRALREAGLKYVVRVDEGGRPLLVVIPSEAPAYPE